MTRPTWVIVLTNTTVVRDSKGWRDTKYVRAATQAGAIRTARANSTLPWRCQVTEARHATPADLGCVEVKP